MVNYEALERFKELYLEKYHIALNDEEALEQAINLLNLMKILIKPYRNEAKNAVIGKTYGR